MQSRNLLEVHVVVVTIAQEGSFIRASRKLGVAQPALTRRVADLEKHLGVLLFQRTSRKVELTKAGRLFVMESTLSLEHAERAWNLARNQAQLESGPIRIGYSPYIHGAFLPHLFRLTTGGEGSFGVSLESASTREMAKRVLRGQLQAALGIHPIEDEELWVRTVGGEGFALCIPRSHRLVHKAEVTIRDLDREVVFWVPRSLHPRFYEEAMRYILSLGVSPAFKQVQGLAHAIEFAAQGLGLALLPRSAARVSRTGVVFKTLSDRYLRIETVLFMRGDQRYGTVKGFVDDLYSRLLALKVGGATATVR
jgi:LysR family transcriptional regulator, benzoate and cis,cis-muconate-responsive activator of ben and cat genes